MSQPLTETELRAKAVGVLEEHLGPVDAMRFLSLLRNASRDYKQWQSEHFQTLTPEGLIEQLRTAEANAKPPQTQ